MSKYEVGCKIKLKNPRGGVALPRGSMSVPPFGDVGTCYKIDNKFVYVDFGKPKYTKSKNVGRLQIGGGKYKFRHDDDWIHKKSSVKFKGAFYVEAAGTLKGNFQTAKLAAEWIKIQNRAGRKVFWAPSAGPNYYLYAAKDKISADKLYSKLEYSADSITKDDLIEVKSIKDFGDTSGREDL